MKSFLFLIPVFLVGCVHAPQARRELAQEGYTDVQITGYARGQCAEDDDVQAAFKAKRDGAPVDGVWCREWFERHGTTHWRER